MHPAGACIRTDGEIAVIEVKCAEVSAGVVKRFCYESQIPAGAGGEIASVDLLVKEKLIFAILLYIIECLVGFGIALFKGSALGAHAQSGREGSAVHLHIVRYGADGMRAKSSRICREICSRLISGTKSRNSSPPAQATAAS